MRFIGLDVHRDFCETNYSESPLLNDALPADDVRCRIHSIRDGFDPRATVTADQFAPVARS